MPQAARRRCFARDTDLAGACPDANDRNREADADARQSKRERDENLALRRKQGSAGLGALREVRKLTESFVLINDGPWGTMCARVGCMPSKALIEAACAFHRRHDLSAFGVLGGEELTISGSAVLARVRQIRDVFVEETRETTNALGARAVSGRARLLGPNRFVVNGDEYAAERIILATGSRPIVPEAWRALGDCLLTTDTLFEQPSLPDRLAVLGLGPVGVEVAQALARLGCELLSRVSPRPPGSREFPGSSREPWGSSVVLATMQAWCPSPRARIRGGTEAASAM